MKIRLTLAAASLLAIVACSQEATPTAGPPSWTEDYVAALAQAKQAHKQLLLNFTGSDWCAPCQNWDRTVAASPDFQKWAAGKFLYVTLDYPSRTRQDDAVKTRNAALKEKFKVEGYPTILVIDADEKELGRTLGFAENGTAASWVSDIQQDLAKPH